MLINWVVLILVALDIFADGARNAPSLEGRMLGFYAIRILPSKTAIALVNPTYMPRVSGCSSLWLNTTHSYVPFAMYL